MIRFLHLAGIIIGLGAVTVIDTLGFLGRKSVAWTRTTIAAHHVTKPLIWIGTALLVATWPFLYVGSPAHRLKTALMAILVLNGMFLSFYVSPRLDAHPKGRLLPKAMQAKITVSFVISFVSWWTLVWLTR